MQTPHVPPSFAQCLQYLQFLQALHGLAPVHVANSAPDTIPDNKVNASNIDQSEWVFRGIMPPSGPIVIALAAPDPTVHSSGSSHL